jgi:protein SCO1/2
VILAGCGASGGNATSDARGFRAVSRLPAGIVGHRAPRIQLSDARGGTVDTARLAGRAYAVTFLYSNCPDVCPLIADEIRQSLTQLGATAKKVAVVAVSVDPRGDTATAVRDFLKRHREPANFHYLIGSEAQLRPTWKAYFAAPQVPGDPESSHTASVWLIDPRGRIQAKIDGGAPFDPADLTHDLRLLASGGAS